MIINDINSSGNGVGKEDGKAIFVSGTIPGENVKFNITKDQKSYALADLTTVLEPSAHRVKPACPYFLKCGGCSLLHMDYEMQLISKQNIVRSAMERIGKLDVKINPIVKSPQQFYYRNKASFAVNKFGAGYFAENSHDIVDIDSCELCHPDCIEVLKALKTWSKRNNIRHIVVRVCQEKVMVTVVTANKTFDNKELISILAPLDVASIYVNFNKGKTILGNKSELIHGDKTLTEKVFGNKFPVSPTSFLQVNPHQTESLYKIALKSFDLKDKKVLDAYCGIGTITLAIAKTARSVVGVELSGSAIKDAKFAAKMNDISNTDFYNQKVEDYLAMAKNNFDIAFLDPPKSGLDVSVISSIAEKGIKQIAYISCSPQTLARDLARFVELGYTIGEITPVDMFPNTAHVETVVLMSRVKVNTMF